MGLSLCECVCVCVSLCVCDKTLSHTHICDHHFGCTGFFFWQGCIRVPWLTHMWDMTHLYVRHDSLICETCVTHMWDMTHSYVRHDSLICETWLTYRWDMTHSYVRYDSLICETWLTHMWDMTHSYVWNDSLSHTLFCSLVQGWVCVPWLTHVWDMFHTWVSLETHTHPWTREQNKVWEREWCQTNEGVMSHICVCRVSYMSESCLTYEWVMSHICVSHDSLICVTWLTHMFDITLSHTLCVVILSRDGYGVALQLVGSFKL